MTMHKGRALTILVLMITMMSIGAAVSFAAPRSGGGGQQGAVPEQQANAFSGYGVVASVDPTTTTVTVTMDGVSRLLKEERGNDVVFSTDIKTKVYSCQMAHHMGGGKGRSGGGKGHGGMGSGGGDMMGYGGGFSMTFADIQAKDTVFVKGYFDAATSKYVLTKVCVWL